jgi:hypothetical protein
LEEYKGQQVIMVDHCDDDDDCNYVPPIFLAVSIIVKALQDAIES